MTTTLLLLYGKTETINIIAAVLTGIFIVILIVGYIKNQQ